MGDFLWDTALKMQCCINYFSEYFHNKIGLYGSGLTVWKIAGWHENINDIYQVYGSLGCFTLCPKKGSHLMFDNNFGKCGPIFKILSPTDLW